MPKLWADSLDEHRALVRRRLVAAFVKLLADRPLDEITVAAVAERAGLARSAVYNHVDHLHDLALLHAQDTMRAWTATLHAAVEDGASAFQQLELLVRSSLRVFASDTLAGMDLVQHLDEERAARLFQLLAPVMAHLRTTVADGVASGELVAEDPDELAGFVWATIAGYRPMVGDGRVDPDDAADTIIRLLRRAILSGSRGA